MKRKSVCFFRFSGGARHRVVSPVFVLAPSAPRELAADTVTHPAPTDARSELA